MKYLKNPSHVIYLLAHGLIFVTGVFVLNSQEIESWVGKSVAEGVGISLVAAAIAGAVVFVHVATTEDLKERVRAVVSAGIINVFPARSARIRDQYDKRLNDAKQIDILALGLSNFRQDYAGDMVNWCRNARIRILVIHPDYPNVEYSYSKQRDLEEGNAVGQIKIDSESFVEEFRELSNNYPKNLQIKYYKAIPAVNILRADDELFWGPYIFEKSSRNMPTFIVKKGGYLFDSMQAHFDSIWNNDTFSEPV